VVEPGKWVRVSARGRFRNDVFDDDRIAHAATILVDPRVSLEGSKGKQWVGNERETLSSSFTPALSP